MRMEEKYFLHKYLYIALDTQNLSAGNLSAFIHKDNNAISSFVNSSLQAEEYKTT